MECELLDRYPWPTRAGLRTAIFDFIEVFYNRQRRHSILDYHPPAVYEDKSWTGLPRLPPASGM
jgi:putative transposase